MQRTVLPDFQARRIDSAQYVILSAISVGISLDPIAKNGSGSSDCKKSKASMLLKLAHSHLPWQRQLDYFVAVGLDSGATAEDPSVNRRAAVFSEASTCSMAENRWRWRWCSTFLAACQPICPGEQFCSFSHSFS